MTPFPKAPPSRQETLEKVHQFPLCWLAHLFQLPINYVDIVAHALLSILQCIPDNEAYLARWLSLTTSTAFRTNLALQSRAFITLGVLCHSAHFVTDYLVRECIQSLQRALKGAEEAKSDDLPVSIISCMSALFEHAQSSSPFFRPMFWIAITFLQIGISLVFLF